MSFLSKLFSPKKPYRKLENRLLLDHLESRDMLSVSGFTPDYDLLKSFATSTTSGYTPSVLRTAYGFANAANPGTGQTIAIVDAYNDPSIASDLATFDNAYGIAAANLKVVNQTGGSTLPAADSTGGWEVEESLDVEWAHAIAQGATILLVEANSSSDSDLFAAVNYARQQAGVSVISMSWGSDDNTANASSDQALSAQYLVTPSGHAGITFVASAGDDGNPSFPAESPNVLAVGGTDLYVTGSDAYSSETAWEPENGDSGGGGVSQEFAGRDVPDVSYNAGVGMAVYDSYTGGGGWSGVGGTSAGAPQWAALVAIADQERAANGLSTLNSATQTIAAVYSAPAADFHDVTVGSTATESAGVGYDLATGIGSPVANNLIPYLAAYGSSTSSGGSGTTSGGTTTLTAPSAPTNLTATALSATSVSLTWTDSATATGYNVYELESGKAVEIGSLAATASSASITGLTAGTTYSFEVAAINTAGSTSTNWVQVTTQTVAAKVTAPTNFTVSALSSTSAKLNWNAVSGATGYQVYEWNGSQAVQIASLTASTISYTASGLAAGSTQYFYVTAYNGTSSASTAWVSLSLPASVSKTLSAPVVTATATSSTTGKLSWASVPGATSYSIYYWNGYEAVELGSVTSASTSIAITGLAPGSATQFAVVASNGTVSAASSWVTLTT